MNFLDFFTDPVLRGPTWGTLLMSIASSLMGAILFLKRRCLLGESLSHAAYPGAMIGVSVFTYFFPTLQEEALMALLGGAFLSSFLGFKAIDWMEKKKRVHPDAALCFILALSFGIGTVAASAMQQVFPSWRVQLQSLMFGQAATLSDVHILLYGSLTFCVVLFAMLAFRPISAVLFDLEYSKSSGLAVKGIERTIFGLFLCSLILGVKSIGIVLMSGMTILPVVAARQFTNRLSILFFLSALFGAVSGFLGNIFSVIGTIFLSKEGGNITLPTGPAIILTGALFTVLSLFFAPKRGFVFRICRIAAFRFRCVKENILKSMWKQEQASHIYVFKSYFNGLRFEALKKKHGISFLMLGISLWWLRRGGWIDKIGKKYILTTDGRRKAISIVRLHRLWELYLASELRVSNEKIHLNAEEMEHILTPDIEERLTKLLSNPKLDPHAQPIPERARL